MAKLKFVQIRRLNRIRFMVFHLLALQVDCQRHELKCKRSRSASLSLDMLVIQVFFLWSNMNKRKLIMMYMYRNLQAL
jgi:hypothetical protein